MLLPKPVSSDSSSCNLTSSSARVTSLFILTKGQSSLGSSEISADGIHPLKSGSHPSGGLIPSSAQHPSSLCVNEILSTTLWVMKSVDLRKYQVNSRNTSQ